MFYFVISAGENGTEEEKKKAKNSAKKRTVNAEQELTDPKNEPEMKESEKKAGIQKQVSKKNGSM